MSASRKTENREYPLYAETDITDWLTDFNNLSQKLDRDVTEMMNGISSILVRLSNMPENTWWIENDEEEDLNA